jgi:hypothetical protein
VICVVLKDSDMCSRMWCVLCSKIVICVQELVCVGERGDIRCSMISICSRMWCVLCSKIVICVQELVCVGKRT